jgi:Flp pilus assembly pilin Flp
MNQRGVIQYLVSKVLSSEEGQDVAEYSMMLAVILVIAISAIKLIGSNAGNVFSRVGSAIQ